MPTSAERADVLVDTSVAVPLISESHVDHDLVFSALVGRRRGLAGHAAFETFSTLTRMPPPHRISSTAAARAIATAFPHTVHLGPHAAAQLLAGFAMMGIRGGAIYDALVGAAAREHDLPLATRDTHALHTYRSLGVRVEFVG